MRGLGVTNCQIVSKSNGSLIELIGVQTSGSIQGEVDHCDPAIESKRLSMPPDRPEIAG
jgi:hypothetical protein